MKNQMKDEWLKPTTNGYLIKINFLEIGRAKEKCCLKWFHERLITSSIIELKNNNF